MRCAHQRRHLVEIRAQARGRHQVAALLLVDTTAESFVVREASADKAYAQGGKLPRSRAQQDADRDVNEVLW